MGGEEAASFQDGDVLAKGAGSQAQDLQEDSEQEAATLVEDVEDPLPPPRGPLQSEWGCGCMALHRPDRGRPPAPAPGGPTHLLLQPTPPIRQDHL